MPRVVPSDVVRMIDRLFPDMASNPRAFPQVGLDARPPISALVRLIEAVPESLLVLTPERYAELTASAAYLRAVPESFQGARSPIARPLIMSGFEHNPIAMIRAAMAACPDEAPAEDTVELAFISDPELRESIVSTSARPTATWLTASGKG
jgi:hypothetical protein